MRMVCDNPYILDNKPYECPKIDEIERMLPDLLEDPERKIIVFSEWVRMLGLVREYAVQAAVEFAWHTGSVPPQRRRAGEDPGELGCRLDRRIAWKWFNRAGQTLLETERRDRGSVKNRALLTRFRHVP